MPMPSGPYWKVRNPLEAFGTAETIGYLVTAIEAVEARFPGSPRVVVGDLSRPDGGRLNRHRSHQAGRDVDLGFYYARGEARDFQIARQRDLDLPRTWALVRALVTETDVDRIFVDRSLIAVLYAYARDEEKEDRALAERRVRPTRRAAARASSSTSAGTRTTCTSASSTPARRSTAASSTRRSSRRAPCRRRA